MDQMALGAMHASFSCPPLQELRAKTGGSGGGAMDWALALAAGAEAVQKYGGAAPGCRTMLDALLPAADACLQAAEQGGSLDGWMRLRKAL